MANDPGVTLVAQYLEARLAWQHDQVLALCTPDIVIDSQRDGVMIGSEAVRKYLQQTPPQGVWEVPERLNEEQITMRGKVSAYFMTWPVIATYDVVNKAQDGQPPQLYVSRVTIRRT